MSKKNRRTTIKLESVRIEVEGMGEHVLSAIYNSIFKKKHKVNVVTLRIEGKYTDGFLVNKKLNLMSGDSLDIKVKRKK